MSTEIKAVTHTEKVIAGEVDAVTHLEKVIAKYGSGGGGGGFTPTTAQLAAMNSGIDSTKVQQISTNETNILTEQQKTTGMGTGGRNYIQVNGIKMYFDTTAPTGDIPADSIGIWGNSLHFRTNNIFDKNNTSEIYLETTLRDTGNWETLSGGSATVLRIPCKSSTEYTIKTTYTGSSVFRLTQTSNAATPTADNPVESSIIVYTSDIDTYTFTTNSTAKYLLFQVSAAVLSTVINNLMMNEGSSALPYEPYWT